MIQLFLEQNPPSQAIQTGVVSFVVLIFIVARALTTRGFAALKPGFNTRAIVTWLACTSLAFMVVYSAVLARTLYTQSMAGYFAGPKARSNSEPPTNPTEFSFPITLEFRDMSQNPSWDFSNITPPPGADLNYYYVLAMKPISLYSFTDKSTLYAMRLLQKASQCGLMASLLLLNTYWSSHVEALVDEGNFMSDAELYLYWILTGLVLVLPIGTFVGVGYGSGAWKTASVVSDVTMLLLGLAIIIGYTMTCLRLRALERDSRNVNGDDTATTLQLTYYIYCVYWLIGSMIAILLLGILYNFDLVHPEQRPVLAQAVSDLQGALWSTTVVMVYPAVMFLLYPSVDVLTKPQHDPASMFQKRVRRTVKDAQRIRESLYLEGDSMNGADVGYHSSLHGHTAHPGTSQRQTDDGQQQQQQSQQQQRYSFYEPKRRERMGSLTAAMNEMQLIAEEDVPMTIEMITSPGGETGAQSSAEPSIAAASVSNQQSASISMANSDNDATMATSNARDESSSSSYNQYRNGHKDRDLDRTGLTAGSEQTVPPVQRSWDDAPSTPSTSRTCVLDNTSDGASSSPAQAPKAIPLVAVVPTTPSATSNKPVPAPLTGILKSRTSTSSTRSSLGQNPSQDQTNNNGSLMSVSPFRSALSLPNTPAPAYGVRTSSVQALQYLNNGPPRKSSESVSVKRRASNPSSTRPNLTASASLPSISTESLSSSSSSQQRRSNVTARVDAGALALAAQHQQYPSLQHSHQPQQQSQQPQQKQRSSRDGIEVDYFGLQKFSFEKATPTPPPSLPYEPQTQQLELAKPPTMSGFLMADPYPSAGTRYLEGDDSDRDFGSSISLSSDSQDDMSAGDTYSQRSGSSGSSKKYKAPPPPIPVDTTSTSSRTRNAESNRTPGIPATPTTPTTPPGVRPRRSLDTVVDQQFIEMANRIYDDHVVPSHTFRSMSTPTTPTGPAPTGPLPAIPTAIRSDTLGTGSGKNFSSAPSTSSSSSAPLAPIHNQEAPSGPPQRHSQAPSQPQSPQILSPQPQQSLPGPPNKQAISPPGKSPYRVRESFESRIAQADPPVAGTMNSQSGQSGQGPATPPSPTSTASPTITSATTLPRPLTPAWYETKTNFASTNDVLSHYNAVMRGGTYHRQQQQQQQQQPYIHPLAVGPLNEISVSSSSYQNQPLHPLQSTPLPQQQVLNQQPQQQLEQNQRARADYSHQARMGSADSFGVVRRRSSSQRKDSTSSRLTLSGQQAQQDEQQLRQHQQQQQLQQPVPHLDRHSFMMPSENVSVYSTWTGDLSDVTNTSGEVSVGAFLDRKYQHQNRKSGERRGSTLAGAAVARHSTQSSDEQGSSNHSRDTARKSQVSAYSMGSSFGAGPSSSSSRQSGGAYSSYSNNSNYESGPLNVSGSLSNVGQSDPMRSGGINSGGAPTVTTASSPSRFSGGPHKKRASGLGGAGAHVSSSGSTGSGNGHVAKDMTGPVTTSRMNSMRLSAFGPGEDDVDVSVSGEGSSGSISGNTGGQSKDYLVDVDPQMCETQERMVQQEWMERRAAVKKDSRCRLKQLQKQQQELDEKERLAKEQQQGQESGYEEPYALNSVYFKSTTDLFEQFDDVAQSSDTAVATHPFTRVESAGMSSSSPASVPATLPSDSSAMSTAVSSASATTNTTAASSPSPHPSVISSSPSPVATFRPYGHISNPSSSSFTMRQPREREPEQRQRQERNQRQDQNDDEEPNPLIPSSSSYTQHHQSHSQNQSMNSSLLHYDSIDSIATLRAHRQHPSSTSSPPPSISRHSPYSPSPSPTSQRPLYGHYQYPYPSQPQQLITHGPSVSLTQLGPSQYRITPEDKGRDKSESGSNASRTMSPVQRTSSRLTNVTNLTNPESEYQWESAELNHHHWEMLEAPNMAPSPSSILRNNNNSNNR
ncbi:hypothetical protein BG011_010169 [Mortierella polycephala]|uniref:Uncharacterized protein n=1 Tax=Mortierella polycephala TaxID=41804 RepID=A0A9P6PML7_9FUNG|nr:hypothetical protein BG011_010169 [Mortierella polycephala]